MKARTDWLHVLTPDDVTEIEAAMRPLAGSEADIARMTKADFPLPTLGPRLARICAEVIDGRGFALLRGMPVQQWSVRESATAYFGIGCHFGNARSQNGKGHVLGHVRDLGRDAVNDPNARIYQTRERQTYHTDSSDIVALLCLKTAKSGGASALVSSMTIYKEMYERRPDLLPYLFEAMGTDRRGEIPAGEKPWHEIPVYNFHEGYLSALYARRYIESARRFPELPALSPAQVEALDLFDSLAEDPDISLQMEFQPGDMQWVHNHTMLHDRTSFEDWPEPERKRHLLRLWLAVPGARPLPQIYTQRYGTIDIGDRGGIIVPGASLNAPLEPV
ncbi:MAG: TauD/TfdA family dioxygenase [Rhodospirillaceae bacterium]|nr:TauD/TfdA family dioxygenase [Rhodospirillaceae bacterium]MBT5663901.1 TauD/TfdA family dioxygenase [Rhodospirillaceae bacterium]MBT5811669.1 TauD/TfdA family dioxygenase [Rhodospirillaceae bacterium]